MIHKILNSKPMKLIVGVLVIGIIIFLILIVNSIASKFWVGLFILAVVIFFIVLWDMYKLNKIRREYEKEKDLSWKGEQESRRLRSEGSIKDSAVGTTEHGTSGLSESQRRELLQTVIATPIDKVSNSRRKKKRTNVRRGV